MNYDNNYIDDSDDYIAEDDIDGDGIIDGLNTIRDQNHTGRVDPNLVPSLMWK